MESDECSEIVKIVVMWLHNFVNTLKTIELYILNG